MSSCKFVFVNREFQCIPVGLLEEKRPLFSLSHHNLPSVSKCCSSYYFHTLSSLTRLYGDGTLILIVVLIGGDLKNCFHFLLDIRDLKQSSSFLPLVVIIDAESFETSKIIDFLNSAATELDGMSISFISTFLLLFVVLAHTLEGDFMSDAMASGAKCIYPKPISHDIISTLWIHSVEKKGLIDSESECGSVDGVEPLPSNLKKDKKLSKIIRRVYTPVIAEFSVFPSLNCDDHLESLKKRLFDWSFNAYDFSEDDLLRSVYIIFDTFGCFGDFNIRIDQFKKFILVIQNNYYSNPYHNFYHAVDVLQAIAFFIKNIPYSKYLSKLDIFALLVASYTHDVGHPGFNNMFMINARTAFALLYNDRSVLESYHAMVAFSILQNPDYNFLTFAEPEFKGIL